MRTLALFLKIISPVPIAVGLLHLVLGLKADAMLGARLPPAVIADPVLDSQNRFYGVAFMLYGVLLYVGASDLKRYLPVVRWTLWLFFAAGLARLLSIALHGVPSPPVLLLLAVEVIGTPVLLWWISRAETP